MAVVDRVDSVAATIEAVAVDFVVVAAATEAVVFAAVAPQADSEVAEIEATDSRQPEKKKKKEKLFSFLRVICYFLYSNSNCCCCFVFYSLYTENI